MNAETTVAWDRAEPDAMLRLVQRDRGAEVSYWDVDCAGGLAIGTERAVMAARIAGTKSTDIVVETAFDAWVAAGEPDTIRGRPVFVTGRSRVVCVWQER